MSCYVELHHDSNVNLNMKPKMNVTTIKHLQANNMIMTCHVRHIFMPIDQTIEKLFISHSNLLNVTFQSHSAKQG